MLLSRGVNRFAQRDRLQVVAAGDFRLDAVFESAQELRDGADEGLGEPGFGPARRKPVAGLLLGGEIERARCVGGVARPADGAAGQAFRPLDTPADVDVALGALAGGAGP